MNNIVIGAGFGDEGKGHTVSQLIQASNSPVTFCIRFNGGHQAGHTVEHKGVRHVFSNFGAGSMHGVPTYWSRFCTIHPKGIRNEFRVLRDKGVTPVLFIDPLCPVTTPIDISVNQVHEKYTPHGSVGVGFGTTIERHEKFHKIYAQDLLNPAILRAKLECLKHYYGYEAIETPEMQEFLEDVEWLNELTGLIDIHRPDNIRNSIFEGAQGILLDQDFGFFPHVTRSKCTSLNARQLLRDFSVFDATTIHYVTRAYHTRHGDGPFTEGTGLDFLKPDIVETNVKNEYQGVFRTAPLNIDLVNYAMNCEKLERQGFMCNQHLHVTCVDHHKEEDFLVKEGNIFVRYSESKGFNGKH